MAKKDDNQRKLFTNSIHKMPEGYYSGDKPNHNLQAFIEQHIKEHPYDPKTDCYDMPAFDRPIETTKATAIYNMHTYWSKKPHDAIRQYIRHYTNPRDLVLDPFCGSGGTALAALMEGRKAVAIDRSPAATFITKNYCTPIDVEALQKAYEVLQQKVKSEIDWLYETRCDHCGGKATTHYTVYSQVYQCSRCMNKTPLFDCIETEGETAKGKPIKIMVCPYCYKNGIIEKISTRGEKYGSLPVLVSYVCTSGCKTTPKSRTHNDQDHKKREYFEKYDIGKLNEIKAKGIPYWYPDAELANEIPYRMLYKKDFRPTDAKQLVDFFTKRNLWALSTLFDGIKKITEPVYRDVLSFALTGIILGLSRMNRYMPNASFPFYLLTGTYYIPAIGCEEPVWKHFENKVKRIIKGYNAINDSLSTTDIFLSTENACSTKQLLANSIDYIFTDPPYADNVQYGELNFIWEAWLGFNTTWHDEEIIVNEFRGKTENDWSNMMRQAMSECYRVLKPGRWLSLCYHDTSEGTWALIQDIMAEVGFIADKSDSALFIDTEQKSFNQLMADKVNKRDLVINFRKPKPNELSTAIAIIGNEDKNTFNEKVQIIIREYLEKNPGSTKDRIYDEVVSRMVRRGQMEAHDFEEILQHIAEDVKSPVMKNLFEQRDPDLFGSHENSQWYLKETELAVHDDAEQAKEDKAAEKLETFMKEYLRKNPSEEGVHYSNLFEQHVYTVKEKPRRPLSEWLSDYFYKTEDGTWRPPTSEEEEKIKADGRAKGIGRRIKRYLALIEQSAAIPDKERPTDATLAEWIRHCRRSGLFERGRLLYEKGGLNLDNLSEDIMVATEEDYQVCTRMLARIGSTTGAKPKRTRKNN